ncbi:MAG: hypothetical protein ACKO68_07175, partial [Bacteroidota bacterium]
MKKLILVLFALSPLYLSAQNSEFYGFFEPSISHLVPIPLKDAQPANTVLKPNFKGREDVQVDQSQTHNPDWV